MPDNERSLDCWYAALYQEPVAKLRGAGCQTCQEHEVPGTDSQIEQLKAEWDGLDRVTVEEFRLLLTAAEDRVFYQILLGNRDKPLGRSPLTANERRLLAQIRAKWATFRAER